MPTEPPVELNSLTSLARHFLERRAYDEAAQLFEMALRLDPKNVSLQLNLARVKRLQKELKGPGQRGLKHMLRERLRRSSLDAKHFLGLAYIFYEQADYDRAQEYIEIALAKDLSNPSPYKLRARIQLRRRQYRNAVQSLLKARRFNPFDRETQALLGRGRYECREYEEALIAHVDSFLLVGDYDRDSRARHKEWIAKLKGLLKWENDQLLELFHSRQEELRMAYDRLELHKERFDQKRRHDDRKESPRPTGGRIEFAARLRKLDLWAHLTDDQIFALTEVVSEEYFEPQTKIFSHLSEGSDIYLLERGAVTVQRNSHYGEIPLGLLKSGEVFGEMSFMSGSPRSADAFASNACRVLRLDGLKLRRLLRQQPLLGVQIYWSFWHQLAFKLRCTNEQLKTFFPEDDHSGQSPSERLRASLGVESGAFDEDTKIRIFREQGLSSDELMALAAFSKEKTFKAGSVIFREGDSGDEMYIVLSGKIMISKYIQGIGEEALAFLGPGDFFGEMSLIDGKPRSADARAHEGPVSVIVLRDETIAEVLNLEPRASLQFMELLCRLIASRLAELDEKIFSWRIMSGQVSSA